MGLPSMSNTRTNIVFLSTGTGRNLGDRAILLNVVRLARGHLPEASLSVSTDVPSWLAEEFGLEPRPALIHVWGRWACVSDALRFPPRLRKWLAPVYHGLASIFCALLSFLPAAIRCRIPGMEGRFINSITNADFIYFSGGGYLTDKGMTEARALLWTAIVANWHGAKLVMTGQGLGPFSSAWTQWLARRVVGSAEFLVTREAQAAAHWLGQWNIADSAWSAGVDDACSLPFRAKGSGSSRPTLAVHHRTSSLHPDKAVISRALLEVMREHLARGYQILLFVFQEVEAMEVATYGTWVDQLPNERVRIVKVADPRELRAQLAACDRAVGTAYHFILFSLLAGIPSVAVFQGDYYQAKFEGLAKIFQCPESLLEFGELSAEAVTGRLDRIEALGEKAGRQSDAQRHERACDQQIVSALQHLCAAKPKGADP